MKRQFHFIFTILFAFADSNSFSQSYSLYNDTVKRMAIVLIKFPPENNIYVKDMTCEFVLYNKKSRRMRTDSMTFEAKDDGYANIMSPYDLYGPRAFYIKGTKLVYHYYSKKPGGENEGELKTGILKCDNSGLFDRHIKPDPHPRNKKAKKIEC